MWSAIGAIGSGLLNLFGTSKTNDTNMRIAQMNNEFNAQQSALQYQRQINMWNMQNEYNTPTNQLQRLKDAGLSPYLAYSDGAAGGSASSMTAPSAVRAQEYQFQNPLQGLASALETIVPSIQNYLLRREQLAQERTRTNLLPFILNSQIERNNSQNAFINYKTLYQQMYNGYFGRHADENSDAMAQILRNRASASTYDKMLADAKYYSILASTRLSNTRNTLADMQRQYFSDFGYNGRLDWQGGLLGQGMKGIGELLGGLGKGAAFKLGKLFKLF